MKRTTGPAMVLALTLAAPAHADWEGKGELGGVLARGNTETETLSGKLDMTSETDRWKHMAGFSVLHTVNDGITSADRYELRGESQYKLTERSYLFGALRYEDDRFTDYDYQFTASAGYGYRFIDTEATQFDGKIGLGFRRSELRLTNRTEDDMIVRGALDYSHQLTDTTRIYDKFLVEAGSDNTYLQNIAGLEVRMTDALALGLSYEIRHNTDVLPGTKKTDQVLTANLVFGF